MTLVGVLRRLVDSVAERASRATVQDVRIGVSAATVPLRQVSARAVQP